MYIVLYLVIVNTFVLNVKMLLMLNNTKNIEQEAHGPHRSPEKQVQIKKHKWLLITFIGRKTLLLFWENWMVLLNPWVPFNQGSFVPSLVEIGPMVLDKNIINFVKGFLLFRIHLPCKKDVPLHLNELESPSSKDALGQVWLKLAKWFWRRKWKCEKFTD